MAESENPKSEQFFPQVDILKAICILFVIVDHTIPWTNRWMYYNTFWERVAIPIFLILMGFNIYHSLDKPGNVKLKDYYSKKYWSHRFWRILFPFLMYYVITTLIGLCLFQWNFEALLTYQFNTMWKPQHIYLGLPPFAGPGDWFLPLLIQSVFLLPLFMFLFKKNPKAVLLCSYLFEIAIELVVYFLWGTPTGIDWHGRSRANQKPTRYNPERAPAKWLV